MYFKQKNRAVSITVLNSYLYISLGEATIINCYYSCASLR